MKRLPALAVILGIIAAPVSTGALEIEVQRIGTEETLSDMTLFLRASYPRMVFAVDSDNDQAPTSIRHAFTWYRDTRNTETSLRIMELSSSNTGLDDGDLRIDGQLSEDYSFDLAETFRTAEALEPGELVRIDPSRWDGVRRSREAYDRALLGVISTRPGIVMGGVPFSIEDLRDAWGQAAALAFERERPALEAAVLGDHPELAAERERLQTLQGAPAVPPSPELEALELHLHDEVMRRFFSAHFAPVAVSGRVPVRVDASFGAIRPGDYLTSSPVPGVAMKAALPGPIIGTALQGLGAGSGQIQVFIHRGWYGGQSVDLASAEPALERRREPRDTQIELLRQRIADLETLVHRLVRQEAVRAIVPATAP